MVVRLRCGSQDLTLQAILSNGVATVRQTLSRVFSAMAAERAKKGRKLVLTPVIIRCGRKLICDGVSVSNELCV